MCHGCGLSALLPASTFGRTVLDTGTGRADRNVDSVRDGYRILISRGVGTRTRLTGRWRALSSRYSLFTRFLRTWLTDN